MAREFENGIVVAVDARDGFVATEGWAEKSDMAVVDLARRFEDAGVASILFTDVGRDGMLTGCNIEATVDLARRVAIPVIASGGVKGLDDIRMLSLYAKDGIEGVITGRAIYDGRLDLATAIAMAEYKRMTVRIRVIPCLDVANGRVVKGVNFVDLKDAGDPVEQAQAYDAAGADELCFLDITASHEGRDTILDVVRRTAEVCFMPLTVGGGVRNAEDARALVAGGGG